MECKSSTVLPMALRHVGHGALAVMLEEGDIDLAVTESIRGKVETLDHLTETFVYALRMSDSIFTESQKGMANNHILNLEVGILVPVSRWDMGYEYK